MGVESSFDSLDAPTRVDNAHLCTDRRVVSNMVITCLVGNTMPIAKLMCICSPPLSGFVSPSVHSITNAPSSPSLPPSPRCAQEAEVMEK